MRISTIPVLVLIVILSSGVLLSPVSGDTGSDRFASGDYAGAITEYEQELPGLSETLQAPVLNNIGTCYVSLGQPEKAVEYYNRAVNADPSYGRGWINLGVVHERLGSQSEALICYNKVSGDPALLAEAAVKKGTLLAGQKKLDEALAAFQSAEPGASGQVAIDMYTGIGGIEFMKNDIAAAEMAFLNAIDIDPSGAAMAYTNLGVIRIAQNRYANAKSAFESAIQNDPQGKTKSAQYLSKLEAMGVV